jgi:hypothetical protein
MDDRQLVFANAKTRLLKTNCLGWGVWIPNAVSLWPALMGRAYAGMAIFQGPKAIGFQSETGQIGRMGAAFTDSGGASPPSQIAAAQITA